MRECSLDDLWLTCASGLYWSIRVKMVLVNLEPIKQLCSFLVFRISKRMVILTHKTQRLGKTTTRFTDSGTVVKRKLAGPSIISNVDSLRGLFGPSIAPVTVGI